MDRGNDMNHSTFKLALGAAAVLFAHAAMAQVKIAYIDPLSGGAATIGEHGLKQLAVSGRDHQRQGWRDGRAEARGGGLRQQGQPAGKPGAGAKGDRCRRALHYTGQRLGRGDRDLGVRRQVQRAQPWQGGAVLQLCGGGPGADQREVQLLALPLGRKLRHQDGRTDQLHEGQARRSRRSTSSARTTRSDMPCATRPTR